MMRNFLRTLVLLLALAGSGLDAWAELPHSASEECQNFIKNLPKDVEYGFIEVPENYQRPLIGPRIPIFYYARRLSEMRAGKLTPMVYFNGGPGYSTHSAATYFWNFPQAQGVPFLYIDQRGTGCSGSYPEVPATLAGAKQISLYGTRQIVMDAERIRKKVFSHRKWNLFGQSYGTAIIHRYVAIAPKGVDKAFAHGLSMMSNGIQWVQARLLAQRRVSLEYLLLHPEDEPKISQARAQIPSNYCTGNLTAKICGEGVIELIPQQIGFRSKWDSVHSILKILVNSEGTLDLNVLRKLVPNQVSNETSMDDFMAAVVATRELPGGLLQAWSCKKAIPELLSQGQKPDTWFYNECRTAMNAQYTSDSFIEKLIEEDYLSLPALARGLQKNPELKLHLYSAEYDTFSPKEGCEEVVQLLGPRIEYTHFMKTGHDWLFENQIWADLKR